MGNNVLNQGIVAPGILAFPSKLNLTADYTQKPTGKLQIRLADTVLHDQLNVTDDVALDGTLEVQLINNFVPAAGDSFDILNGKTITGNFAKRTLPVIGANFGWDTSKLYTTGVIAVADIGYIPGDTSRDGHFDKEDLFPFVQMLTDIPRYVITNGFDNEAGKLIGDINGDGKITNADMQALLDKLKTGGGSVTAVPEPSTLLLAVIGLGALLSCGHRPPASLSGLRRRS